jgi:hypothetical protein
MQQCLQDKRRGPIAARTETVDVFSEVVGSFNAKQGVVARGGETPMTWASQQVQQDAAALLEHIIDELHDETRSLRRRCAAGGTTEMQPNVDSNEDEGGWLQVQLFLL